MRDILLTAVVLGSIPFILKSPSFGLLIWSWLGYMNPNRMTYGFAYSFPFVEITAIVTILGLVVSKERVRFPWSGVTIAWLLWTVWFSITTLTALNPASAHAGWDRSIKIQAMVLVTLLVMGSREKLNRLVWVIVVSIGYFGVKGGIFTMAHGGHYRVWGPADSFIEGNNELALALLTILPLMRYLQLQYTNKWIRHGLSAAMALCGLSILGSYSRGALLGGITMVALLWLKSRRKIAFGVPLVVVAVLAVNFMPQSWDERMHTVQTYQQDASAMGRINAWHFAFRLAEAHPITGGGFNTFNKQLFAIYAPNPTDVHAAHSIYFEVLGEQGFVGLGLYLLFWLLTLNTTRWIRRNTKGLPELLWASDLARLLQVCYGGFAVGGAFLSLAYWDLPWQMAAIAVLAKVLVKEKLKAAAPAKPWRSPAAQFSGRRRLVAGRT